MNDLQKRFADRYLVHRNGSKAAVEAGYSPKTSFVKACQLMKHPEVSEYIKKKMDKIEAKDEIDALWVRNRFKMISDRCVQEVPVLDSEGMPTGEFRFDSAGANKATESLGKIVGAFEKDNEQKASIMISISNEDAKLGSDE